MNLIQAHDRYPYSAPYAQPNVKALRRILAAFLAATALASVICMLVIMRDIRAINNRPPQKAAIHHCTCKGAGQCIR